MMSLHNQIEQIMVRYRHKRHDILGCAQLSLKPTPVGLASPYPAPPPPPTATSGRRACHPTQEKTVSHQGVATQRPRPATVRTRRTSRSIAPEWAVSASHRAGAQWHGDRGQGQRLA
jgi:hypothetical protein